MCFYTHLILIVNLRGKYYYYYLHFTDEKIELQKS